MKIPYIFHLTLLSLIISVTQISCALIYIPGIPVSNRTLFKTQVALNRWQNLLQTTYGTRRENPGKIKIATDLVVGELEVLSQELSKYNNALIGGGNQVLGNKNIIIGNRNAVYGSNNYVFSQDFDYRSINGGASNKMMNNTLVADQWVGELDKRDKILKQLHSVIYPI